MAYDERLAARIRELISVRPDVVEKRLFGGLGWMLQGNMAVGAGSKGDLIVRVEPEDVEALLRLPGVTTFGHEGRTPMKGFVLVDTTDLPDDELEAWVRRGADRALSLPPK